MNRKATSILYDQAINLIILAIVITTVSGFLYLKTNNTYFWSNFYAKETVKILNLAQPGDEITLDIHKATQVAVKNEMTLNERIFHYDNEEKKICYNLQNTKRICYSYFNDINISSYQIIIMPPTNKLKIKIQDE